MIYDVSVPISNTMPVWPGDPPVQLTPKSHVSSDKTHRVHLTAIEMGSHTGTHVDVPFHMVDGGKRLGDFGVDVFVGPATVIALPSTRAIGRTQLERFNFNGIERVLLKTENSNHWQDGKFYEQFVYLEPDGAEFLVERGIRMVGIDYLSIDRFNSDSHPSHFVLLNKNVVIIEGLNLKAVPSGNYTIVALPLNLQDSDGAPTRVILTN